MESYEWRKSAITGFDYAERQTEMAKKLRLQEELKKQIEEKDRIKWEEQERLKQEELIEERKVLSDQYELQWRYYHEEGKKVPNEVKQQFETI